MNFSSQINFKQSLLKKVFSLVCFALSWNISSMTIDHITNYTCSLYFSQADIEYKIQYG